MEENIIIDNNNNYNNINFNDNNNNNFNNNNFNNNYNINNKELDISNSSEVLKYLYSKSLNNKNCFDCLLPNPTHVSITNGILLCPNCAQNHMISYPYYISYIREIRWQWDNYLLSFMERGGNGRLIKLFHDNGISYRDIQKSFLYATEIMDYYRMLIKSEIICEPPPNPPNKENYLNPINPIDNQFNHFPEFNSYQIYKGDVYPKEGIIQKTVNFVSNKINKDAIVNTGITVGSTLGKGLKAIYYFTKPIVKKIGKNTLKGIGYTCNAVADQLKDSTNFNMNNEEITNNITNNINNDNIISNNNNNNILINNNNNDNNYIFVQNTSFPTFEEIRAMNENNNNNI